MTNETPSDAPKSRPQDGIPTEETQVIESEVNGEARSETSAADEMKSLIDDLKDRYLRAMADMENMRKRQQREIADIRRFAVEKIVEDILPALDDLEKATNSASDADTNNVYLSGMMMIQKKLQDVLMNHGLTEVASEGHFDPTLHQAINRVEVDGSGPDTVAQVFAKGYMLNGRLVRPAIVSVACPRG